MGRGSELPIENMAQSLAILGCRLVTMGLSIFMHHSLGLRRIHHNIKQREQGVLMQAKLVPVSGDVDRQTDKVPFHVQASMP